MNYTEIELWINQNILRNCFSLSFLSKNEKIFEEKYDNHHIDLTGLNSKLITIGKKLGKTKNNHINWFKINFVDNTISDLVGIVKISDFKEMNIFSTLLTLDKADQNGDSVICLFNQTKEWIIKINHCRDERRIYIRTYGKGKIIELLKN